MRIFRRKTHRLTQENFGSAKVYAQNAQSVLNKATGFISAYDFTLNPIAAVSTDAAIVMLLLLARIHRCGRIGEIG
jgi:hypothetical protein